MNWHASFQKKTLLHVYEAEADDNIFVDILFFLQFYSLFDTVVICWEWLFINNFNLHRRKYGDPLFEILWRKVSTQRNCWLKLVQVSSFNEINADDLTREEPTRQSPWLIYT